MVDIDEREVQAVIQRVRERLGQGSLTPPAAPPLPARQRPPRGVQQLGDGIFADID
ncbi:MAG: hypothetical protein ACE5F6_11350 [Anaerolineae bacterium]